MIKEFLMRKMLESKMKDVPQNEREKIIKMMEKNPALFQTIALEIQEGMKSGKGEQAVALEVLQRHQTEIAEMMK